MQESRIFIIFYKKIVICENRIKNNKQRRQCINSRISMHIKFNDREGENGSQHKI
jgi:hypothetical protein